jgi:hypothetical protein
MIGPEQKVCEIGDDDMDPRESIVSFFRRCDFGDMVLCGSSTPEEGERTARCKLAKSKRSTFGLMTR